MGRQHGSATNGYSTASLGQWIGEALGEGIALGTQRAFEEVGQELAPLVGEIVESLRQELAASMAQALSQVEVAVVEHARLCEEPGCSDPALARNLCRRHYARKLYQERKSRDGVGSGPAPRRRVRVVEAMGETVIEKKLAAVAPIIRRKKVEAPAVAEAIPMAAAANGGMPPMHQAPPVPLAPSVSVESIARFFGLNKG